MWPIWELKIFGNRGFFKVMAMLARYEFVDKYGEYIMFWVSYMCDLAHGLFILWVFVNLRFLLTVARYH